MSPTSKVSEKTIWLIIPAMPLVSGAGVAGSPKNCFPRRERKMICPVSAGSVRSIFRPPTESPRLPSIVERKCPSARSISMVWLSPPL